MADWQPGDLALCVRVAPIVAGNFHNASLTKLRCGAVYGVVSAFIDCTGAAALLLDEVRSSHPEGGFRAERFRKINPLTDEEREDAFRDLKVPEMQP